MGTRGLTPKPSAASSVYDDCIRAAQHGEKRNKTPAHPGSPAFQEARLHLPAGPQALKALFEWAHAVAKDIVSDKHIGFEIRSQCLHANIGKGVLIFSDHSGTGNSERSAVEVMLALCPHIADPRQVNVCSVCDPAPDAAIALSANTCRAQHHTILSSGVADGIPEDMMMKISCLLPPPGASPEERTDCYNDMYRWMTANLDSLLPPGRKVVDIKIGEARPAFLRPMPGADHHSKPNILWISGTECYAFLAMGKQLKTAHDNFETFLLWFCHIKRYLPDIVVYEITELHPEGLLEFFFGRESHSFSGGLHLNQLESRVAGLSRPSCRMDFVIYGRPRSIFTPDGPSGQRRLSRLIRVFFSKAQQPMPCCCADVGACDLW